METVPLQSARYATADHEPYLNCVVDCESDLDAQHLYNEVICPIEDVVGHSREEKWRPRELDVDVLFWAHNDAPSFHLCTPLKVRSDRGFAVPHTDVWARPFLMDLIESDLKIDSRRLRSF
jgi:2-amino-4-hydroxy-6-hydroxymethyldihydropteridine diphosphokinase